MGGPKKVSTRVSDDPDELSRVSFQAILLADSFATTFRPITLERPKVLLPLVNVPMINYTLSWLESAGVEEVFVFCCAHSKQVIDYLEKNGWLSQPNFTVTTIESHNSVSAGDALRLIYEQNVIHGDFVLISGDTVSNMSITRALQEHKDRRKKDNNAVMTMVIKQSKPNQAIHQSRLGTDELFMAIDPDTKQLLYYEDKADFKGTICLDKSLLADNPSISLHNDKQDCYIDICSPEVLSLFTDNFDYQHLRRHFVKGLLVDDIMGYKIFIHDIHSSYAARIDNFRSYDTVSKDIIHRWTYPLVPDLMSFGNAMTKLDRQGIYRTSEIAQSRSAMIGPFTVIGRGTQIGDNTKISNSVIGEGCSIGSNVCIEGSYVWNNVTIEDGCDLRHAIVCDGVTIKSRAVLEPGSVLSFKTVIGQQTVVPAYSKVSLFQQPMTQDSDEELEYADSSNAITVTLDKSNGDITSGASESHHWSSHELGVGGVGYIWSSGDGGLEEEWKHSVAPIPADKVAEAMKAIEEGMELTRDDSILPAQELQSGSNDSGDDDNEDLRDESLYFEKEVEATFQRAVHENIKEDIVILEVNSLRLSYNKVAADCAGALFYSMMRLALESSYNSANELFGTVKSVITKWRQVLKSYLTDVDDQIEVILKFEEICSESGKEFSPLFTQILSFLYDKDIVEEDAILSWEEEKRGADDLDKVFVTQAQAFIQWLREASEEEDEE